MNSVSSDISKQILEVHLLGILTKFNRSLFLISKNRGSGDLYKAIMNSINCVLFYIDY